mgnify:CR=1 FL=1
MSEIRQNSEAAVHELIAGRWSPRAFDPTRKVSRDQLLSLLEAARWAPSCFGDEPWRFVIGDKDADEAGWNRIFSSLAEKNQLWAKHAPLLILAVADSQFRMNGNPNRWGQYDSGAASISLCLQAEALGLSAHQMGGFDSDAVRESVGVSEQFTPMAVIAVGYQGSLDDLAEDFHGMETAPRKRQPLAENFFSGRWGREV